MNSVRMLLGSKFAAHLENSHSHLEEVSSLQFCKLGIQLKGLFHLGQLHGAWFDM
jgi:hypothetical protein